MPTAVQIQLYRSLFRGRTDVYAVRWEKNDRSGYMPAYKVDWDGYNAHKAAGGNFASYANKEYLALDDTAINDHLNGNKTVGLYPLLTDNTSYFIVADFDEANWAESIVKLQKVCEINKIPAYIERSRSGNGGHLWIFFEENIPAFQSRAIMFALLLQSEILSRFDKEPSFDRLFPNQDEHSGKGLGNLIALPLQGKSVINSNSCFIDPVSFEVIKDQWQYLSEIKRVSKATLEMLYLQLTGKSMLEKPILSVENGKSIELEILIRGEIYLRKADVNKKLTEFLRDNLNFLNSDYFVRQNMGRTAHNIEKYFKLIKESGDGVIIPRGFASKVAIYDTRRNEQIVEDIKANIDRFKMILVLTERKAHVDVLNQYLKSDFETITISGDDSERSRKSKLEQIEQGHCKIVISTGQFFGEGIDVSNLECLFIVYPFAFEAKLVQYIGRIQRSKQPLVIFDYRDVKIDYFEKMFKKRNRYYNKLRKIDYDEKLFAEE